jgi:hypothetical protein
MRQVFKFVIKVYTLKGTALKKEKSFILWDSVINMIYRIEDKREKNIS